MNSNSIDPSEIRKTGIVMLLLFGGMSAATAWFGKSVLPYIFGFLALVGCGFILFPHAMAPVYRLWQQFGHAVGRVFTAFTLTIAYYLVITPAALMKRWFGSAPLPMKPDKSATTYWVNREEGVQSKGRFEKRY